MAKETIDLCAETHDPSSQRAFGGANIYVDTISSKELEELTGILLKDRTIAANAVEGVRCREGAWQEAVLLQVVCHSGSAAVTLVRDTLKAWGYDLREVNMVRQTVAEAARHKHKLGLLGKLYG